jgi:hypothetical protein
VSLRLPVYPVSGADVHPETLDRVVTGVFGSSKPTHEEDASSVRATSGSISAILDRASGAVYAADVEHQWKPAKNKLELPPAKDVYARAGALPNDLKLLPRFDEARRSC